jgi:hypothetical protein
MYEDNSEFLPKIKAAKGWDFTPQGKTWDRFVDDLWGKCRTASGMPPTDGWKKPHPTTQP